MESADKNGARLRPDTTHCAEDWFYWYFRVSGAAGRTLRFEFPARPVVTGMGPLASFDGGTNWRWLGYGCVEDWHIFTCTVPEGVEDARFAMSFPYVEDNLKAWLNEHGKREGLKVEPFCKSAKGREVELLRLTSDAPGKVRRLLFTVRHHACESIANYALEGLLEAMLSGELRRELKGLNVEVLALPFMDKDGVEQGEQGKSRRPHDHGRDYKGESIYPETGTLRRLFPDWAGQRLSAVVDLHCPWIRGQWNEQIYQVGSNVPLQWERQRRFGAILEKTARGPLRYRRDDDMPFGVDWNSEHDYDAGESFVKWAAPLSGVLFSTCFEMPYGIVHGRPVTPDAVRSFGHDLARALTIYLSENLGPA